MPVKKSVEEAKVIADYPVTLEQENPARPQHLSRPYTADPVALSPIAFPRPDDELTNNELMGQQEEIQRLKRFHTAHFPGQRVPEIQFLVGDGAHEGQGVEQETDDGLGHYEDGVKRTLTEAQIRMFRHSEIQRLLIERRRSERKEEEQKQNGSTGEHGRWKDQSGKRQFADDLVQQQDARNVLAYDD